METKFMEMSLDQIKRTWGSLEAFIEVQERLGAFGVEASNFSFSQQKGHHLATIQGSQIIKPATPKPVTSYHRVPGLIQFLDLEA